MSSLRNILDKLRIAQAGTSADFGFPSEPISKTFLSGTPARLALSTEGEPQLLLPASNLDSSNQLPAANGLDFSINRYKSGSQATQTFIQIRCMISDLEIVFLDLAENICERIREGGNAYDSITAAIIDFRELLNADQISPGLIKAIGLFGELLLLEQSLAVNKDAVRFWTGPKGGRRDFVFPKLTVEVKTTQRNHERYITIHALDQLATKDNENLYIWFYAIEENPGNGRSVSDLVNRIEELLDDSTSFRAALSEQGYTDASGEHWDRWKWSVLESQPYLVDDDFPKITADSFIDGAPGGISHVTYRVNLDTADSSRAEELKVMEHIAK